MREAGGMWQRNWKSILIYGIGAFGIGFVFGALRELVLIPAFGERGGHWAEFPLVTAAICLFGYWLGSRSGSILTGLGGVGVLLAIEAVFALGVLRQPLLEFLAGFDVTKGALLPFGLAAMAVAPWLRRLIQR